MDWISIFRWPYWFIGFHLLPGFIGFLMYLSNPNSRPSKLRFCILPLIMCHLTGFLGLFYGFVCFSTRKK